MSPTYECPSCGAEVTFQSSIAVFAVCSHCRSMVVRRDVNVEAIGQMAQLPPDLSPLQIGAQGQFDGQPFTLIGRARMAYDEGSWNEWCALFGDGRTGWVAEAQGFFMVSFEKQAPADFPAENEMTADQSYEIDGQPYRIADRKESECVGAEGELPFAATPGRKGTGIDLTGAGSAFAGVEYSEAGVRLFVGRYARFDDLKFTNLRPVPGWSENAPIPEDHTATVLNCPNCGAPVALRAAGFTMSATCGSCGSLIDTATPALTLIRVAHERKRIEPVLPLGRRGTIFGVNYEVIGFQQVKDQYSGWQEYLLFNPWQGFVWLVTYHGHWSFVRRLFEQPEVSERRTLTQGAVAKGSSAAFENERYVYFAASEVTTTYVLGEFYWKVSVGMPAHVTDFIKPPRILSREAYPQLGEVTWSQGEYVEPKVIQQAFKLESALSHPTGPYLNQPNPYAEKGRTLKWLVPLLCLVLFGVQIISAGRAANQQVLSQAYLFRTGVTNPIAVTQPFELKGGNQALDFALSSPVDNKWLELDIDLVNARTHQILETFTEGVEYYHGYDSDGAWTEGNQTRHQLVAGVPPGTYYLTIDASADTGVAELPFTLTAVRDVMVWSNFWIGLGLLLIYPLYCWYRASAFESARWAESD